MATTKRNATKANEITEVSEAKVKAVQAEDTRFTADEISNMIVNLLATRSSSGDILIANVVEDDSIANNCKFAKAVMTFIESVIIGNSYDAISSLTEICTNPRYTDGLNQIVAYLRATNGDFNFWIKNCLSQNWKFNDALLNTLWNMKGFNRAAAITLYGVVTYLSDMNFKDIEIYGYYGDITGLNAITESCSVFFRDGWED